MNYRHQYHAGNFADVFKHTILLTLLDSLSQKEKPWCYLETHAGRGLYDLFSIEAQKTQEFQNGIAKIFPASGTISRSRPARGLMPEMPAMSSIPATPSMPLMPATPAISLIPILKKYQNILENTGYPQYYPGSPLIAYHCSRSDDRLILIEKQTGEAEELRKLFKNSGSKDAVVQNPKMVNTKNISIHQQEGYQGIKAFLPPKERRALILIDPPYEQDNEWQQIIDALKIGLQRFSTGIYVIWYPIKTPAEITKFHRRLSELSADTNCDDILIAELCIYPEDVALGLKGAGMAIIHPPWRIELKLNELLEQLFHALSVNKQGRFGTKWLKPTL